MKKLVLFLVLALMLCGCGKDKTPALSASDQVLMEQMGVDMNAFDKMRPTKQEQVLEDLGLNSGLTLEDAQGQGRYVVVLSDTPGYNSFTLYYEDGVLIHVITAFRGSAQDTPVVSSHGGYRAEDYHYKNIHMVSLPLTELAQLLREEGFAQISVAPVD